MSRQLPILNNLRHFRSYIVTNPQRPTDLSPRPVTTLSNYMCVKCSAGGHAGHKYATTRLQVRRRNLDYQSLKLRT